ncbi:MAG: phage Gp19/Gp15/Gp42 family protein [Lachnospiraceae bacterium]|nr:phage Gp19/Gp15/Gp42 family protein [Lachnospiraceae bacterium]
MKGYVTIDDVITLFRPLTPEERAKAEELIPIVLDSLRVEADKVGKDLDIMLDENEALRNVLKSVVVDVVGRTLNTSTKAEPMSQMSESALGYSVSGTFLVPGGGLFIKKSELARLGIKRQRIRSIEIC